MKALENVTVLLVGPESTERELLAVWLSSEGASLHCSTWATAPQDVVRIAPAVVVADLREELTLGEPLLLQLRAAAGRRPPVVALVQGGAPVAPFASAGDYNKYIKLPAHPADVVSAIASLVSSAPVARTAVPETAGEAHEGTLAALLKQRAERSDMRGLLALLNATGPFRFTSILRFDADDRLTSVWTFDRENRESDSFPIDATVASSYCSTVRETEAPFAFPDAGLEPSVASHPKRHALLSYCGVPLRDADAALYGSLCHYDFAPRFFADRTVDKLASAAAILRDYAPEFGRDRQRTG